VCFEPAEYLGDEFRSGIALWLFKRNVGLVAVVVLTNDPKAGAADIGPGLFALKFR